MDIYKPGIWDISLVGMHCSDGFLILQQVRSLVGTELGGSYILCWESIIPFIKLHYHCPTRELNCRLVY